MAGELMRGELNSLMSKLVKLLPMPRSRRL